MPINRNPETLYRIKCDVGASKNAGQAFSTPRLSSHFILYKVSGFLFFGAGWNQDFVWKNKEFPQKSEAFIWDENLQKEAHFC